MSRLRRSTLGIGTLAVCVAAVSIVVVASAGAQPAPAPKTPAQLRPLPIPRPFHITRIVPSDKVSFDITASTPPTFTPNRSAEVRGGVTPSFVFNTPGGWNQVTHVGTGHYCLNGGGFNYPAVVSVANRFGTANVPGALVQYDSFGSGCPGVGVFTYQIVP